MSAITAKTSRKMKKYAVLTREPRCFLGSFDFSWEQRKVGDLLIERNQQAPMSDEYPLMAFIANEGVAPKGELYDRSALVTDTVNKLYKKTEKGDFIYSSNNLETGSIGLNKYGKACISPVYSIFEPTGIADSDFLGRRLVRKDFINAMVKWRQGVIYGQWRIHESDFLKIEIPVPSVEEQRKIGAYLDQLDNLITLHQRKCALLFSPFQALISMMFTTSTFSWEQRKAIDIADYSKGNGYSKGDLTDAGTPIILYGRLYTKYQFAISEVDTFAFPQNGAVYSQGNEVIVPASGETAEDIARASAVEKSGVLLGGDLNILRPFDFINPLFLALAISNGVPQKELAKKAQGKSVVHIHNTDIQEVTIAYPSRTEQDRIVSVFRQLDNLITLHQRKCISFTGRAGRLISTVNKKRITSSWEQRKFEEIAVRSSVICSDDTLPRVEYEDIVSGTGRLNKDIYAKQSIKSGIAFHQGDVLYGKLRPYLQNWLLPTFDGLAVGDFWVLQPQNADSSFLYRLIQSRQFDEVANQSTGTKMPRADWKLVSKTVFSIPSNISEQAAIGTYFTALDSLITLHQRQPFSHSTPDISLSVQLIHPFYTSSWEQRKLGDIGKARSGVGFPDTDQGGVTGVPFFKVSDMNLDGNENEMIVANNYVTAEQIADHRWSPITELPAIFFAKVGAAVMLNRKRLCRFPFLLDNNTMAYSLSPTKWDADFAKALFGTVDLTSLVQVGALPSYNAGDVESMGIYLPSLFEQEQIGAFFKLLDNLITLHQRKGKAAVSGCSNVANNSKGVCCKARDFGYKCHKKDESK